MNDWEVIKEGSKRVNWPWETLAAVGESFVATDPRNVANGRQSVFQANKRFASVGLKFKGVSSGGVYTVTRVS